MNTVFIHTNNKQSIGAVLSRYSLSKNSKNSKAFKIEFINVDELPEFQDFHGKTYLRNGQEIIHDMNDLQSFTLSRFMPPQLMYYQGRAVVIDPDIFAIGDVNELFALDMQGNAIAVCRKKDAWDSSMMLLDCAKLKRWKMEDILGRLERRELDYVDLMTLKTEKSVLEVPRIWNNLDTLTPETMLLHTTNRLTQPWKTGLKIDFHRNPMPRLFGIIPREWVHRLLGKYPTHYQPHPDKTIEQLFFRLVKDALAEGALKREFIEAETEQKHVRPDLLQKAAMVL